MRTVTFVAKDTVAIVEKPQPKIEADEVLVRIGGAGVCHSDLAVIGAGEKSPVFGGTLGHEIAGTVEAIGDQVRAWQPGDRVIGALVLCCGRCRHCLAGRDNECEQANIRGALVPATAGIGSPGGMADYIALKEHHLISIGDLDPVEAAPLADAALTPMHAINSVRAWMTGESTVLVIGLGGLGHMALQILSATSGARVIAVDTDISKLDYAREHGASLAFEAGEHVSKRIFQATEGRGVDVVLDFAGVQPTIDLAVATVRAGGAIRFVGLGGGSFTYRAHAVTRLPWGVNIERAYGGTRAELIEALGLARDGKLSAQVARYSLDDAAQAFQDLRHGRVQGRAVLVP